MYEKKTYVNVNITEIPDKKTIGNKQYPRTLITQVKVTPVILIKFNTAYIQIHPRTPTP